MKGGGGRKFRCAVETVVEKRGEKEEGSDSKVRLIEIGE